MYLTGFHLPAFISAKGLKISDIRETGLIVFVLRCLTFFFRTIFNYINSVLNLLKWLLKRLESIAIHGNSDPK